MSTEVVALIAAAGTALGALIGAAAGGVTRYALDRVSEKRRARAGARLLRIDLAAVIHTLDATLRDGLWYPMFDIHTPAWGTYSEPLAVRLSDDEYKPVADAMMRLGRARNELERGREVAGPQLSKLSAESLKNLRSMREVARRAFDALGGLAQDGAAFPKD